MRWSLLLLCLPAYGADWLVTPAKERATFERSSDGRTVTMADGLIRRVWRLEPAAAAVAFDNLMTGASLLRGVRGVGSSMRNRAPNTAWTGGRRGRARRG